jgi:hypothetical protein
MDLTLNYWMLFARIFKLDVCRTCGKRLDTNYRQRRRGKLCADCNMAESLGIDVRTIDIDTLY